LRVLNITKLGEHQLEMEGAREIDNAMIVRGSIAPTTHEIRGVKVRDRLAKVGF